VYFIVYSVIITISVVSVLVISYMFVDQATN